MKLTESKLHCFSHVLPIMYDVISAAERFPAKKKYLTKNWKCCH